MSAEWFFMHDRKELGPFSSSQLKTKAKQGQVSPDTMVRRGDSNRWIPARKVKGLFPKKHAAPKSPEPDDGDVVRWIEQPSSPDQQPSTQSVKEDRSTASLETEQQYSPAPEGPTPAPPRSCPSCGATLAAGQVVCSHCGFDPRTEKMVASSGRSSSRAGVIGNRPQQHQKTRSYPTFVGGVISEIWYMFTFRSHDSTQLYGFLLLWYLILAGCYYLGMSDVAAMHDVYWTPSFGVHIMVLGMYLLAVLFYAILGLLFEAVSLGIAIAIMRLSFPDASLATDVIWDLFKWKTAGPLAIALFSLVFPVLGFLGALLIYLFLPPSIYSQRLGVSFGKAFLVSLLTQVMPAVFCCGATVRLVVLSS